MHLVFRFLLLVIAAAVPAAKGHSAIFDALRAVLLFAVIAVVFLFFSHGAKLLEAVDQFSKNRGTARIRR